MFANQYHLFLLIIFALTVVVGVGLNVLIGLTGQVSFGHVGFYALGAYTSAVLTLKLGIDFWWTLPIAALVAGVVGTLLGLVALRVSGPYLAMVTIAFAFVVEFTAIEWESLTGGQNGLNNIPFPSIAGFALAERGIAIATILLMTVTLALYQRMAQSGWGLAMRAVRDSEIAAGAMGVNPLAVRTLAFTVSAVLAGIAGAFFASATTFIAPSTFPFFQSILFVLVVIIGGAGTNLRPGDRRGDRRRLARAAGRLRRVPRAAVRRIAARRAAVRARRHRGCGRETLQATRRGDGARRAGLRAAPGGRGGQCSTSSKSATSASRSAACAPCRTCRRGSRTAGSPASSGRTAPARRRC